MIDETTPLYAVSVYLRGENLNPEYVTSVLGLLPSKSQFNNEERTTSTKKKYKTKIGVWAIKKKSQDSFSKSLGDLISVFDGKLNSLDKIVGVEEAYLDIFVTKEYCDSYGGGDFEFEIEEKLISRISDLGLKVKITTSIIPPKESFQNSEN